MKKLILLAILLRILVSVFLFHPDIKTYYFQSSFLKKGVFNIYTYLVDNKKNLPLKDDFVYFPLTYFFIGGYSAITSPLLGQGFTSWLSNANSIAIVQNPNIFGYLFVMKLPLLILDLLTGFLIMRFFDDRKKGEKAFMLWLFNPFTIFIIYAFSNIDIYAVLLTVIAFLLLEKNKLLQAAVAIGLASCFKLYPLLFIPFLFLRGKNTKEKVFASGIPLIITALIILPFWSTAFVNSAFVSGLTTRIFNPGFSVGFGESIILGLFLMAGVFYYAWLIDKNLNLFNYWVIFLLIIFSFSHFHIAWLLWPAPFLIILAVKRPKLSIPILLLSILVIFIPVFYEDRSMTISLFRIYSTWFDLLPTPFTIVKKFYDPYNLQSLLHSLFAGGSMVAGYLIFRKETDS